MNKKKNFTNKREIKRNHLHVSTNKTINGIKIIEQSESVGFLFNGTKQAYSNESICDILKLCDGFILENDFRISSSYVRIEIDPSKTTNNNSDLKILRMGIDGNNNYFSGKSNNNNNNNNSSHGLLDYIYIYNAIGSKPIDYLKSVRDKRLFMELNKDTTIQVFIEITMFYFYIPSLRSKIISNTILYGYSKSDKFHIKLLKNSKDHILTYEEIDDIENKNIQIIEQNNNFNVNDFCKVFFKEDDENKYIILRIINITDDFIRFEQYLPSDTFKIIGTGDSTCFEDNCTWHNNLISNVPKYPFYKDNNDNQQKNYKYHRYHRYRINK